MSVNDKTDPRRKRRRPPYTLDGKVIVDPAAIPERNPTPASRRRPNAPADGGQPTEESGEP